MAGRSKDLKSVLSQSVSESSKQDNLSKIFSSDSASISKHEPCFLELLPTTKSYQKRLRELQKQSKESQAVALPFYQLFKDQTVHRLITEDLFALLSGTSQSQPKKTPKLPKSQPKDNPVSVAVPATLPSTL